MNVILNSTLITSGLLGIFGCVIAISTIKNRRKSQSPWKPKDDDVHLKAHVAAHSNFVSYTPLFLIVLAVLEMSWPKFSWFFLIPGILFFLGRISHFYGMTVKEIAEKPCFKSRQRGMYITIWSLILMGSFAIMTPFIKMFL